MYVDVCRLLSVIYILGVGSRRRPFTFYTPFSSSCCRIVFDTLHLTAPKFVSCGEKRLPIPNAGMADVDEGGFPVETRAKPKILQVDGRPPLPALLCACDTV